MKNRVLFKIVSPIIIVGLFVIFVFVAVSYGSLSAEIYGIFALVVVFIFLFGFAIGQKFTSPLRQLLDRVEKLSQGEFTSRVYLETKDEFEDLAQSFNKIAEELERSHEAAREAESMADVKVRAKTRELGEEINNLEEKVKNRAEELQRMIEETKKLQDLAKSREAEIARLRKEIMDLRSSVSQGGPKLQNGPANRGQPRSSQPHPPQPQHPQQPRPQSPQPKIYQ